MRLPAKLLFALALVTAPIAAQAQRFAVEEATISEIHAAMAAGRINCRELVSQYLARIAAYDKTGPAINAIVVVNPKALDVADSLDRRFRSSGRVGSLHCIPILVKDNMQTTDLPTTAGSLAFEGWIPKKDAFQVRRIREAGAIVIAKTNMAEFAFSPYETVSSILPGYTKNPYALDRVTAGSSGGTAAGVAASFGTLGLGTDTGNSIRGPSSHQALVGIRSTMGLTSRAGVVPLFMSQDIAGPMARTVADAAAVLQVVAGEDPDDSVTAAARGRPAQDYVAALDRNALRGARIAILRQAYESAANDSEVIAVFERAVADLRRAGATVLDSLALPTLDSLRRSQRGGCPQFKFDLNRFLQALGPDAPRLNSLDSIVRSNRYHPNVQRRLEQELTATTPPEENPGCRSRNEFRAGLRTAVVQAMDDARVDALIYPTWGNPPRLIGDLNTPHGDKSQFFSPSTGFPAITVPMGYTRGTLPAGMTLFGRPWSEATLIKLAYAYEQLTKHRRSPPSTPALR
ncbi:MAG TPA: amidase family protein [Gemmatimonadaceae bacterium]|nr:amidase family protein [Gemmatimonadaceae bacterium]